MMQREVSGAYTVGTMIKASSFKKFSCEKRAEEYGSREDGGSNRSVVIITANAHRVHFMCQALS